MQIAIVHILTGNVSRKLLVTLDEKLGGGHRVMKFLLLIPPDLFWPQRQIG